jgi:hypothetical protein
MRRLTSWRYFSNNYRIRSVPAQNNCLAVGLSLRGHFYSVCQRDIIKNFNKLAKMPLTFCTRKLHLCTIGDRKVEA